MDKEKALKWTSITLLDPSLNESDTSTCKTCCKSVNIAHDSYSPLQLLVQICQTYGVQLTMW